MPAEISLTRPTPPSSRLANKTAAAPRDERVPQQSFEQTLKEEEKKQQIDGVPNIPILPVPVAMISADQGETAPSKPAPEPITSPAKASPGSRASLVVSENRSGSVAGLEQVKPGRFALASAKENLAGVPSHFDHSNQPASTPQSQPGSQTAEIVSERRSLVQTTLLDDPTAQPAPLQSQALRTGVTLPLSQAVKPVNPDARQNSSVPAESIPAAAAQAKSPAASTTTVPADGPELQSVLPVAASFSQAAAVPAKGSTQTGEISAKAEPGPAARAYQPAEAAANPVRPVKPPAGKFPNVRTIEAAIPTRPEPGQIALAGKTNPDLTPVRPEPARNASASLEPVQPGDDSVFPAGLQSSQSPDQSPAGMAAGMASTPNVLAQPGISRVPLALKSDSQASEAPIQPAQDPGAGVMAGQQAAGQSSEGKVTDPTLFTPSKPIQAAPAPKISSETKMPAQPGLTSSAAPQPGSPQIVDIPLSSQRSFEQPDGMVSVGKVSDQPITTHPAPEQAAPAAMPSPETLEAPLQAVLSSTGLAQPSQPPSIQKQTAGAQPVQPASVQADELNTSTPTFMSGAAHPTPAEAASHEAAATPRQAVQAPAAFVETDQPASIQTPEMMASNPAAGAQPESVQAAPALHQEFQAPAASVVTGQLASVQAAEVKSSNSVTAPQPESTHTAQAKATSPEAAAAQRQPVQVPAVTAQPGQPASVQPAEVKTVNPAAAPQPEIAQAAPAETANPEASAVQRQPVQVPAVPAQPGQPASANTPEVKISNPAATVYPQSQTADHGEMIASSNLDPANSQPIQAPAEHDTPALKNPSPMRESTPQASAPGKALPAPLGSEEPPVKVSNPAENFVQPPSGSQHEAAHPAETIPLESSKSNLPANDLGTHPGNQNETQPASPMQVLGSSTLDPTELPKPDQAVSQQASVSTQPGSAAVIPTAGIAAAQPGTLKVSQPSAGQKNGQAGEENFTEGDAPKQAAKKAASQTNISPAALRFQVETQAVVHQGALPNDKPGQLVMQQVIDKIQEAIQQGRTSLRMQLNPKDLGSIDVRLVSNGKSVSITMIAEQTSTSQLLETQMDQLRANLAGAGINLANVNIGHQAANGQQGSGLPREPAPDRSMEGGKNKSDAQLELGSSPYTNRASTDSRIDYRI